MQGVDPKAQTFFVRRFGMYHSIETVVPSCNTANKLKDGLDMSSSEKRFTHARGAHQWNRSRKTNKDFDTYPAYQSRPW